MNSMTGFGHSEREGSGAALSVEIKSLNNRYLDIIVNMPSALSVLEDRIRTVLQKNFMRGRVECYIRLKTLEEDFTVIVDKKAALEWRKALESLAELLPQHNEADLNLLVNQEGVLRKEYNRDVEEYWKILEPLLIETSAQVQERRQHEGRALKKDIELQLSVIEKSVSKIEKKAPKLRDEIEKNLKCRFKEILGDEIDEQKILNETALWIARNDINEEIVRLKTHISTFMEYSEKDGPKGKKLDFLAQEMGREINTIGSKTPQAEVSRLVVDMKDALEKIREQLRNVE